MYQHQQLLDINKISTGLLKSHASGCGKLVYPCYPILSLTEQDLSSYNRTFQLLYNISDNIDVIEKDIKLKLSEIFDNLTLMTLSDDEQDNKPVFVRKMSNKIAFTYIPIQYSMQDIQNVIYNLDITNTNDTDCILNLCFNIRPSSKHIVVELCAIGYS